MRDRDMLDTHTPAQEALETQDEEPDVPSEPFRSGHLVSPSSRASLPNLVHVREALDKATQAYIAEHFHEGVGSVFAPEPNKFVIQLVANKYNPSNFWSGRWRSKYEVDLDNKTVTGSIQISVHYYEQGNVSNLAFPVSAF
jgi:hypothetical protein